jgi:hypothetical protein
MSPQPLPWSVHPPAAATAARAIAPVRTSERARKQIVALVTVIYCLLIFEGAIRKWLLPHYSAILFFVRDPFVLTVYWLAYTRGRWPARQLLLTVGMALALCCVLLVAVQVARAPGVQDKQILLAVYGWRNYFLYLPLAFVIGATFQARDVERVIKLTLFLSLPVAILVMRQFHSPSGAPINVGIAADVAEQFRGLALTGDITRPLGTFTADSGQSQFVVSCLAMILALWVMPAPRRFITVWQLTIATGAALTCLAMSGSRGAMLHSGILMVAATACGFMLRGRANAARALLLPAFLLVAAVVLYPNIFPDAYGAFMARWEGAALVETQHFKWGIFGRALYGFVDFLGLVGDTPLFGYGLGLAGNASLQLGVTIKGFTGWAETDWARHIVDLGPIIGTVFIVYRIALVTWLGGRCVEATRRSSNPLPLMLFAFVAVDALYGQMTGQGTINGYCWFFVGLSLAVASPGANLAGASKGARSAKRFPNLCP